MLSQPNDDWATETASALPLLATVAEVAECLRTTPRNLKRWIAAGHLRPLQRPSGDGSSRVLIPRAELVRYLRERGGDAPAAAPARRVRRARATR